MFTNDMSHAQRFSSALEGLQVLVNVWAMLNAKTTFWVAIDSGFGRDMGKDVLHGWTVLKTAILHGKF